MGWQMLRNEHTSIEKDNQKLHIVGVENWGSGGFKQAGDIEKASQDLSDKDFKILLSHDPSHWNEVVKTHNKHFQLTLSGHTHGMQFGIEIPGWFKWSPVQYRYKQWAGIYEHEKRLLNVNRGFGYLAYPGRVGIWPEITVFELKSA
jgi:predicted MPP superfamily phosphohydrolase